MAVTSETFRNVFISDGGKGITLYKRGVDGDATGVPMGSFKHDEYDVKITFTKKPRPIAKGDEVYVIGEVGLSYKVIEVFSPGRLIEKSWAWIYNKNYGTPRSIEIDRLRRAFEIS